jgi:hypothetical protein
MNTLNKLLLLLTNEQEWHEQMVAEIANVRAQLTRVQQAKDFLNIPNTTQVNLSELMVLIEKKVETFQPRMMVQSKEHEDATVNLDKLIYEIKKEK